MRGFKKVRGRRKGQSLSSRITTPSGAGPHFSACHDTYALSRGRIVLTDRLVAADVPLPAEPAVAAPGISDCE